MTKEYSQIPLYLSLQSNIIEITSRTVSMKPIIPIPTVAICNRLLGDIALRILFNSAFYSSSSIAAGSELAVSADNAANFLIKERLVVG